jgi:uncharacterized protein
MNAASQFESFALTMPDGQIVRGDFQHARTNSPAPVVVFAHGFGSVRSGEKAMALADECARRGWAFAAGDFRGHGMSDGVMPELLGSRLLEDLEAITCAATKRACGPLFLVGSSMGGWAAAWLAARQPERIAACALIAPAFRFLEFQRLTTDERQAWQRTGLHRVRNEFIDVEVSYGLTMEAAQFPFATLTERFRTPAIIFHGMADDVVPYEMSVEFAAYCAAQSVEVSLSKSGDHRLTRDKEKIARATCDFFAATID